jgi:hypothetical protein
VLSILHPIYFFILILLLKYFEFSIKDFYYNYLRKLSLLQINIIYNKKKRFEWKYGWKAMKLDECPSLKIYESLMQNW